MSNIDKTSFCTDFCATVEQNGMERFSPLAERFYTMAEHLVETNAQYNLTAITDPHGIIVRHFADSLCIAAFIPENAFVIDVGCGAGFPSLPLALARPDLHITALDSTAKKLQFTQSCAELLGLQNLETLCGRAEELGHGKWREKYDVCVARAVARLHILDELCMPFVKKGGLFLALKGEQGQDEAAEAKRGVQILGGNRGACHDVAVRDGAEILHHVLYRVEKVAPTPEIYPRNYARICKKPL